MVKGTNASMALALESHSLQVNCGMVAVGGVRMQEMNTYIEVAKRLFQ
jgi:hypothetical protein